MAHEESGFSGENAYGHTPLIASGLILKFVARLG
jgi:hypothetical protein